LFKLQIATAVAIVAVWASVVIAAVSNPGTPELVTLATVVTPVMLLPAGWLFAAPLIRGRNGHDRGRAREARDESGS
jgi:hypothetical protein